MYPRIGSCCPNYFFRLLLRWLGLVWRRELGDRADPHAPIFHHYGTAFIHGHEANPIPLRMVCATRQRGGGGSSTSMLSPISGASSQTISVEFMRREWVSFLFNNTITHRSNLSLTLISIHRSMVPLQLHCRAVGRSENPGMPVLFGGHNLLPPGCDRVIWSAKIWGCPRDDTPALQLHCLSETCGNHNNRADLDEPTYSSSSALNLRPMRASRVNQIL